MVRKSSFYLTVVLLLSLTRLSADSSSDLIQLLNQTVTWYHIVGAEREFVSTPADAAFVNDNTRISDEIVRLAFEFARNEEKLISKQARTEANGGQEPTVTQSRYDALRAMALKMDERTQQSQQELDSLRRKLDTATGKKRQDISSDIAETESELQLFEARREVVHTMLDFLGSTMEGSGPTSLSGQIEALSHSVPASLTVPAATTRLAGNTTASAATGGKSEAAAATPSTSNRPEVSGATPAPVTAKSESEGLWGLITNIVSASRKVHTLERDGQTTNALRQACLEFQTPLVAKLKQMAQQSDAIAAQADANNPALQAQEKAQIDQITAQFKLLSASFVPLNKQITLLDLYSRNLTNWRSAVSRQYSSDLRLLLTKLLTLGIVLGVVFGVAEVWRRSIFRYVHDTRRRQQMFLVRRIAVWFAVLLVFIFAFATELGSIATFAGLLTAGVAVALQNVILSIAGYFFLIGKFGVRVGDRVQISGVNGEVIEIGLVRVHVMELGGTGRDVQPTGRVVAFSNSFVFQPTAGVFKQIPGTNFVWHEITLTLAADSDYRAVEQRMIKAVDAAFAAFHEVLEQQRMQMERSLASGVTLGPLRPRTTLKLTSSGLEVKVSFPVDVERAAEIDDRITREILKELDRDPKLKMVGSDIPTIREITEAGSSTQNQPVSAPKQ
jgi:small-conductance mechanosensitive channel